MFVEDVVHPIPLAGTQGSQGGVYPVSERMIPFQGFMYLPTFG